MIMEAATIRGLHSLGEQMAGIGHVPGAILDANGRWGARLSSVPGLEGETQEHA